MWILAQKALLLVVTPFFALHNLSEQYVRYCNIFDPANHHAPDAPLNLAPAFAPDHPVNPPDRLR